MSKFSRTVTHEKLNLFREIVSDVLRIKDPHEDEEMPSIHEKLKLQLMKLKRKVKENPFKLLEYAFNLIPLSYSKFEVVKYRDEHEKDNFCFEVYQKSMEFVLK